MRLLNSILLIIIVSCQYGMKIVAENVCGKTYIYDATVLEEVNGKYKIFNFKELTAVLNSGEWSIIKVDKNELCREEEQPK